MISDEDGEPTQMLVGGVGKAVGEDSGRERCGASTRFQHREGLEEV